MNALKKIYLTIMLVFMYAPILVLVVYSFNNSKIQGKWAGFTLKWYAQLFGDRQIIQSLYYTLALAAAAVIFSVILGTTAAIGIDAMTKWRKDFIMNLTNIPVLNPDIVTGVSFMILFIFAFSVVGRGSLGFGTLLVSHIAFNVPYVILSVLPKLKQLDPNLYEAALDLGAPPMHALRKIILPEIMPGVITGGILAFTLSLDDFIISFFTTGNGVSTLSITIFSMTRRGINPEINAVSALLFVVVMLLLVLINSRDKKKLKGEV